MQNKEIEVIINFKSTEKLKNAIRKAAVYMDKKDSSKFIREVLENNKHVKKYLELEKS